MASVSCGITSMRRSWPFTFNVISRSTAPAADWPCIVVVRNRYADVDATVPAAMTPLMKFRLDTDCPVSSDILLSSIAGSPRRAAARPDGEGICPVDDNPYRVQIQRLRFCKQMYSLTFLGAAGTVTGSKHLLNLDGKSILV